MRSSDRMMKVKMKRLETFDDAWALLEPTLAQLAVDVKAVQSQVAFSRAWS